MTIQSVIEPDLSTWGTKEAPFYLELVGETSPQVNTAYAEFQPPGKPDGEPQTSTGAPVYEYWWTIGHAGDHAAPEGPLRRLWHEAVHHGDDSLWGDLEENAAYVDLWFPLGCGWRIKELVATVKYLQPVREQEQLWNKAAENFRRLEPEISGASSIAGAVASLAAGPAGAGVAVAGTTVAHWLDIIAKVKLNSIPQSDQLKWSVQKVTRKLGDPVGGRVMQGVSWSIPRSMFVLLGGRITGSVAVSFIPDTRQAGGAVGPVEATDAEFQTAAIRCEAQLCGHGKDAPAGSPTPMEKTVELTIKPRRPEPQLPKATTEPAGADGSAPAVSV